MSLKNRRCIWGYLDGYGNSCLEGDRVAILLAKRLKAALAIVILAIALCISVSYAKDLNEEAIEAQLEAYKTQVKFEAKEEYRATEIKHLRNKVFWMEVGYIVIVVALAT